ncbi:MAG: hypothetical protein NTZ90_13285 [Proteobacteria bacterium]|nr:hypothetical protein [Pseudomonadota bacterium]
MDQVITAKVNKTKSATVTTVSLRVKRETKRRVLAELAKVNKKTVGRKVRVDSLIVRALGLLTDADIVALQDGSLSNADRLELKFRDYQKLNPGASKDDFLGQLLERGGAPQQTASDA